VIAVGLVLLALLRVMGGHGRPGFWTEWKRRDAVVGDTPKRSVPRANVCRNWTAVAAPTAELSA